MNHDRTHKINRLVGLALTLEREGNRVPELAELDEPVRAYVIAHLPTALRREAALLEAAVT